MAFAIVMFRSWRKRRAANEAKGNQGPSAQWLRLESFSMGLERPSVTGGAGGSEEGAGDGAAAMPPAEPTCAPSSTTCATT